MTSKELREKRAALAAQAFELTKVEMNADSRAKYDAIMADVDSLKGDIDRAERAAALDSELRSSVRPPLEQVNASGTEAEQRAAAHKRAFNKFIRTGEVGELRTYSPMSDAVEGAFVVPQGFQNELEIALKAYGGVRDVARVLPTATGNDLKWPTANDTAQTGERLTENTAASQANPTFSNLTLKAYTYSTKMVNVSNQLLQDSAIDIEAFLREQFVDRLGRVTNTDFTVGTGSGASQPNGINTAASAGPTTATTLVVSYDDLVELEHSLDRAYRKGAKFMLRDSVLKGIKKLKDSQGHPLWMSGVATGSPDTILGYSYVINDDMPSVTAANNLMLFGRLDKYLIRSVKELAVIRLNERFAELFQTAFVGFARFDGNLIDAGTHPVKALVSA